jgi:hypothetical protein
MNMLPRSALSAYEELPCTLCAYDCDLDMPIQHFSLACPTVLHFLRFPYFTFQKNSGTLTEVVLFHRRWRPTTMHTSVTIVIPTSEVRTIFSLIGVQLIQKLMIFLYDTIRQSLLVKQEKTSTGRCHYLVSLLYGSYSLGLWQGHCLQDSATQRNETQSLYADVTWIIQ